jgi:hypothetical protein
MSKRDFISGTVLEFKVPINLGYAYCKILDFRNIRECEIKTGYLEPVECHGYLEEGVGEHGK